MGLLAPIFLLALPLLAAIIVLYLLKLRRPMAPVASLHLWESLTRDREANSLWQRLRVSLLLLLQLFALLALIIALARPWVPSEEAAKQNAILVIDVSASMAATDADDRGTRTRLQAAQNKAKDIIDGLPQGGTATLIASDDHASIIVPTTDDKARLRAAVDALRPHTSSTDMVAALKLSGAVAARQSNSIVWVLSDGAFPSAAEQVDTIPAPLQMVSFGRRSDNGAITALSIQQKEGSNSLFVQLANSGSVTMTRRLELLVDDQPWNARTVTIPPQANQEMLVDDLPLAARVVQARLSGYDSLDIDNQAWVINRSSVPANVLLVTPGDKFLELALSLLPTVTLYKVAPEAYDPATTINGTPIDLTVFDTGVSTKTLQLPKGNLLFFAPKSTTSLVNVTGTITQPVPILSNSSTSSDGAASQQQSGEPLLRFVDLSVFHVAKASLLTLPKWGREVLASDKGPLIIAGDTEERRVAIVAFDLHDTDLPVQAAFPLLMRNLVTYLLPDPDGGLPASIPPRSAIGIEASNPQVDKILVEDPNGKEWTYPVTQTRNRISYPETGTPGVYYVTQYAGAKIQTQEAFAVNLFSRDESMSLPNSKPGLPKSEAPVPQVSNTAQSQDVFKRELWPTIALAGFFVLLLEWLYAQRIAIRRAWTEMQTRRAARRAKQPS